MNSNSKENLKFIWRVAAAHTISYFVAGIFAMQIFDYESLFTSDILKCIMKPTHEPIVALGGTTLQVFRGIFFGLVLIPLRKVFIKEKNGFFNLGILVLGLSVFSTFGPTFGSIEGFIYTKMTFAEHIKNYPEAILWTFLFVGILYVFYKLERKIIDIIAALLVILIAFMGIMGYLSASGKIAV